MRNGHSLRIRFKNSRQCSNSVLKFQTDPADNISACFLIIEFAQMSMIASVTNYPNTAGVQLHDGQPSLPGDAHGAPKTFKIDDRVDISDRARGRFNASNKAGSVIRDEKDLSEEDRREVDKLKKRDQEVRAHESSHLAAGSGLVMGGASYEYERGPDGKSYVVAGEVTIDTSRERDPEATIRKMQKVRKAALAPAQPSGQDRSVAARASQIEAEARIELQKQKSKTPSKAPDDEDHCDDQLSTRSSPGPFYRPADPPRMGHNLNLVA
jgi:hypothetical protein